jgi:DNA-binding NarL/FixJ family response regulator
MILTAAADPRTAVADGPRARLTLVTDTSSRPRPVRVANAGGSTLVRAAFRALLESERDVVVAGESPSGDEAVGLTRRTRPDVVLMCLELEEPDSVDAIERIVAEPRHPAAQVVVLTASDDGDRAFAALRAGATGFLPLDTEPAELLHAMRVVARGEAFLSPGVTRSLIAELTSQPSAGTASPDQLGELTARELEVMALAADGLSNEEIGERLIVSPATAKTHVSRAMMKLRAHDRSQLVALAYRTGLVRPRNRPAAAATAPVRALALV